MGLKGRTFTGTLRASVINIIGNKTLTRKEILNQLRKIPKNQQLPTEKVSIRRLTVALRRLLAQNKVVQMGKRANSRFQATK